MDRMLPQIREVALAFPIRSHGPTGFFLIQRNLKPLSSSMGERLLAHPARPWEAWQAM